MEGTPDGSLRRHRKNSSKHGRSRRHASESASDSDSETNSSDLQSSDEERRRKRVRGRDKESKRHSKKEPRKEFKKDKEPRKEFKKEKVGKKRDRADDSKCSDKEERRKKRRLLKEAKEILKRHKMNRDDANRGDELKSSKEISHKALSEDDYYEKNKEFSTWLNEKHGVYFSSLSSDDTRKLFVEFVEAWNAGTLPEKFYGGIDIAARTNHKWEFKGGRECSIDREEEFEFMKKLEKFNKKKFRKDHKELLDELLPKETGRERLLEKKSLRREQARLREDSPEIIREQEIMGGGDDFKQRLEREHARKEKRVAERAEALRTKQSAFEEKEAVAMGQLRALVNVAGGKITIPKRMDPV